MNIEQKYIILLSNQLNNFSKKSENLYNFRCFYCGDSKNNPRKTRAYLYSKLGKYYYYCHNCSKSITFNSFLRDINRILYSEYKLESLGNTSYISNDFKLIEIKSTTINLPTIESLPKFHTAVKYLRNRKIPKSFYNNLYYADEFKLWVNTELVRNKFSSLLYDEPRIVIPLETQNGEFIGINARSIDKNSQLRYITIIINEQFPRFYGLKSVNFNQRYYILEGPFDSMFIPNSIAVCGSSIIQELDILKSNKNNAVIIYDNQPRNEQICQQLNRAILNNYSVVIWPDYIIEKDINDMILSGRSNDEIINIINYNIYSGLQAKVKFIEWRK